MENIWLGVIQNCFVLFKRQHGVGVLRTMRSPAVGAPSPVPFNVMDACLVIFKRAWSPAAGDFEEGNTGAGARNASGA